jgi:TonB-linked SusC/RagA family outer membrane protein
MLKTPKLNGAFYRALCLLFLLKASVTTMGQEKPANINRRISISVSNQSLLSVLDSLCARIDSRAVVPMNKINYKEICSIEARNQSFKAILDRFLEKRNISWEVQGKNIIFRPSDTTAPKIIIKGVITDDAGQPLPGANIKIKGTHTGSTTDEQGHFTLTADKKDAILSISYTGYDKQEVAVPTNNYVQVKLVRSGNMLDEVVTIAYGSTSRRLNTGNVTRITDKDIGPIGGMNPLASLQGRVAGLAITASSGVPGTSYTMQIEGRNSIDNGSEPLFIVDGIPIITPGKRMNILSSIASQNIDNGGISFFNNLNGADIESMEVLKGADATAIYGSRGANGVILITTKRGRAGKTAFNLDVSTGIKQVGHMPELLSTPQYLGMRKEAFANDGLIPTSIPGDVNYAPDLTLWDQHRDVNWQKYLMGSTAHTTDVNAAVSGGNKNTQFLFSTGYHHETSVFPSNMGYNKGTFNFNLNHKSANSKFTVDFNAKYSIDDNNLYNAELTSILTPPNAPVLYDKTGKLNWEENEGVFDNPAADLLKTYQIKTHNLLVSIKPGYKITDNLTFHTNFGYNGLKTDEYSIEPISSQNPLTNSVITGSASFGTSKYKNYIIEPQLDYSAFLFNGKISALLGGSWQYNISSRLSATGDGYTNDLLLYSIAAAADTSYPSNEHPYYKYAAVFGRLIYNYEDKYIVNASARRDGSSRFGPQKPYANFGSIGAAWLFTNEDFAKELFPFLEFGKLRSSYGVTGNDQIGDYRYLDLWSSSGIQPYQGIPTVQPQALLNPTFSWERNRKLEVAIELSALHDRVFLSTSYFRNQSDNQLLEFRLPSQSGFMMITRNLPAVIRNTGWELTTTLNLIEGEIFNWTINANLTVPSNKLVRYPGIENSSYNTDYAVGYSTNVIKGYRSTGIDKNTGVYTFKDVDMDTQLTAADYQVLGKTDPKYYGGINSSIKFHQFQLDFLLEFKKQTVRSYYYSAYISSHVPGFASNQLTDVLNRWQHPGDNASIQKFTAVTSSDAYATKETTAFSDIAYTSGTYLKVRNVSLVYNIKENVATKLRLKRLHVYIQGQNLFTFTGYKGFDPETPYYFSLPPLRTVRAGLQIGL